MLTRGFSPSLRGLRKDNTGYDLKQLFIGAEGTLGIVTAAVMKLFPAPRTQATALVAVASVERAIALLSRLKHALSDRLVGFELMSAFSLALSRKHHPGSAELLAGHPWYALVQADDSAADSPPADISVGVTGDLAPAPEPALVETLPDAAPVETSAAAPAETAPADTTVATETDLDADNEPDVLEPDLGLDPNNADTDGDGMPDEWERKFGLNPSDPKDGTLDSDKDGYTNVEEFLNGTAPNAAIDYHNLDNNVDTISG